MKSKLKRLLLLLKGRLENMNAVLHSFSQVLKLNFISAYFLLFPININWNLILFEYEKIEVPSFTIGIMHSILIYFWLNKNYNFNFAIISENKNLMFYLLFYSIIFYSWLLMTKTGENNELKNLCFSVFLYFVNAFFAK